MQLEQCLLRLQATLVCHSSEQEHAACAVPAASWASRCRKPNSSYMFTCSEIWHTKEFY